PCRSGGEVWEGNRLSHCQAGTRYHPDDLHGFASRAPIRQLIHSFQASSLPIISSTMTCEEKNLHHEGKEASAAGRLPDGTVFTFATQGCRILQGKGFDRRCRREGFFTPGGRGNPVSPGSSVRVYDSATCTRGPRRGNGPRSRRGCAAIPCNG